MCRVDRVLTGNGSLQLIEFLCLRMLQPGDTVFTEAPTYDRTLTLLRRHGADVVGIPIEADGPDIEALERALATRVPKFFYIIPDFQNPAGATCSGAKRQQIVKLAARHGFLLVEDAPYRLLRYRGSEEPTLYELAPEITLHMSSFTKLIAPGVRTGFMIGEPSLIATIAKVAEETVHIPGLRRSGHHVRMVPPRTSVAADRALEEALRATPRCLPGRPRQVHAGYRGDAPRWRVLHLAHPSRGRVRGRGAGGGRRARSQPRGGSAFFPQGGGERFLRLPFCALSPAEIDEGIRRLADSVRRLGRA